MGSSISEIKKLHIFLGDKTNQVLGVGMKLGIFEKLKDNDPITSEKIAKELNLSIRGVDRVLLYGEEFEISKSKEDGFVVGQSFKHLLKHKNLCIKMCDDWYRLILDFGKFLKKGDTDDQEFSSFFNSNSKQLFMATEDPEQKILQHISCFIVFHLLNYVCSEFDLLQKCTGEGLAKSEIVKITSYKPDIVDRILEYFVSFEALKMTSEKSIEFIGGSFFEIETIPKDEELYLLRCILHDWPKDKQVEILQNISQCMKKDVSKLLIVSPYFERSFKGASVDLHTLACYGRATVPTIEEFKEMCIGKGLQFLRCEIISTGYVELSCLMFKK